MDNVIFLHLVISGAKKQEKRKIEKTHYLFLTFSFVLNQFHTYNKVIKIVQRVPLYLLLSFP